MSDLADFIWRNGADSFRMYLLGIEEEVVNAPQRRSEIAAASAAMLIEHRGGDALERAEFARLFATGEPAEGLRAFLEKRLPRFRHLSST